ncbi:MAG: Methyltransferase type 11 [Microgenomates group bacterium GW2011_GWC1_44_37]|uniref:Methyltransferase type 11 n=1 Tax=Candidatus Collierbacteria bacterium GW2011_GWB2_44_22 TaxID=1618387 RepID=A0A0G1KUQ2_9BACT|nr:MAG: Methyltransferase type 11 [Candidatus Collierbacteria bacterium GW2011_GWA2_44_13]KKT51604.1 MAG: Methyltransferase type 11 [Candidatus Collierbacteria bacterium GW2011_GWB2_44_22]KKT63055.1 MAG: Methyltransferase type 11 [Candidatus Collierbacteria bacterium GW2011_GWD1_44_27]KKT66430.1 MAG: Methyltransferase type 11 [Candidatus Collierbacteria bacterium GW2011_GWC2_44_30]KKT68709.1 MAG: Methyltransferase type 11 [Microgenomates group bacterium GW2011_GWC1_44_37]KKT89547.1 MAG: Methyl
MTKPLRAVVEIICGNIESPKQILEIGSRQAINQNDLANVRDLFSMGKFVGVDMQDGPGVDIIASANKLPFPDRSFDLVLCLETLEHADKPWLVCAEIERVIKTNGVAIVSSQQNFPIHKHPSDYFRYTPYGLSVLFQKFEGKLTVAISPPFDDEVKLNPQHVVLVGMKKNNGKLLKKIKNSIKNNVNLISVHKPYQHRLQDFFKLMRRALAEINFRQEIEFF